MLLPNRSVKAYPIIGRDYYANPTLRQMPRHWVLEDAKPDRWKWYKDKDAWVFVVCLTLMLAANIASCTGMIP